MLQELRGRAEKWYVSSYQMGLIYVAWARAIWATVYWGCRVSNGPVEELLDRWRVQEQSK